ncbi:hypothetical protein PACTADRAFT_78158 [Pachysolen tannophilus NRRL Y-2460]|uniref:MoaB/Mog domain-containing protein n=1 Tax=Pachysolen tannophilus NRRL Y-2460 TaxID=669874 RepID=A0A1E4U123_PACTA|nr:hypothetical protein PACTADRAFT_78158 [Pachysolen tannophilus NRRL Y-2460]
MFQVMFHKLTKKNCNYLLSGFLVRFSSTYLTPIKTAGCIVIGDEVLNSKIRDTNSQFFAKYCFGKGIDLKKISIIGDDELEIKNTVLEFDKKFDFIVTSGGIGPTHDDITYSSIAKAFNLPLEIDLFAREKLETHHSELIKNFNKEQKEANLRMVTLPHGSNVQTFYTQDLWVPIVNINNKLNILPGIPRLFERMLLEGIDPAIAKRLDPNLKFKSYYVNTKFPESRIAPILNKLIKNDRFNQIDIKLGCYPHKDSNTVSVTGRILNDNILNELVTIIEKELNGMVITKAQEHEFSQSSYNI